jgi:hypothetical protein
MFMSQETRHHENIGTHHCHVDVMARKTSRDGEGVGEQIRGIPNFHPNLEASGSIRLKF